MKPRKQLFARILAAQVFVIFISLVTGCSVIDDFTQSVVVAEDFSFDIGDENKYVGDEINIAYKALPAGSLYDENDIKVVFSDDSLIKYDEPTGKCTCIKPGNLSVTILYTDKEYDRKNIVIEPVLVSKLYLDDIEIDKGDSLTLNPIIEPENATDKSYTMSIDDAEVAVVSENKLSANKPGETLLHLQSNDGYSYDVKVKVFETNPDSISFSELKNEYYIGDVLDLNYLAEPEEVRCKPDLLSVVFDDENLVQLDNSTGKYNCSNTGDLSISIVYDGKEFDKKTIKIKPILISSLYLDDIEIVRGKTVSLQEPVIEPANATDQTYTISVVDDKIASLEEKELTGNKTGHTTLRLKSTDGFTYDVKVNVVDIVPTSISITGIKDKYLVGEEGKAKVSILPADSTLKEYTLKSSNNNVLSIDSDGKLIAKSKGIATVTAATSTGIEEIREIEVKYPDPKSIRITNTATSIYVGDGLQLYTKFEPEEASLNGVEWSSSDSTIATVNTKGYVTAKKEGNVVIYAKTVNGQGANIRLAINRKVTQTKSSSSTDKAKTDTSSTRNSTTASSQSGTTEIWVWVPTNGGNKYHRNPSCSGMKNPEYVTLEEAYRRGITEACKKCY